MAETVRVLHVDDDRDFAELVETHLTRRGEFEVELESDPNAVLERIRRGRDDGVDGSDRVECIVSDYEMPEMTGLDLLREVREIDDRLPFVLFTSRGSEEIASEAISAGVTDYIQKRVRGEQYELLANRIRNAVDHYRTERALRESEQLYRTAVERSHDAIYIYQGDSFRFVNQRACRLSGYDEAELGEKNVWSLVHPEDRARVREMARRRTRAEGEPSRYRARIVTASGEAKRCNFSVQDITYEGEPAVLGSVREVSDEERATERFQALIEQSSDLVTVLDEDGTIEYGSPSVERILGWTQAEVVGNNALEFVHREDRERARDALDRLASRGGDAAGGTEEGGCGDGGGRDGESEAVVFRVRHADGSWVWLEAVGRARPVDSIDGFVVNSRDVTARRAREQRLRRYESVVRNIQQGAYVLGADRRFEFVNEAVTRSTGLSREDIVGEPLERVREYGLLDDDSADELSAAVDRILDGESEFEWIELPVDIPADVGTVEITLAPLREGDADESVRGVVAISTDVTRRNRYQERLESLHEASRLLSQATTYGEVAEIVSEAATEILDYPLNGVFFREDDSLVPHAMTDRARAVVGDELVIPRGSAIAWDVLESGVDRVFDDVAAEPNVFNPETPIRSEVILPIEDAGVLIAGATEPGIFDDSRTSLARVLVSNAGAALERVDREQLLRRRERELKRQNEQLERVANVVSHDLRNPLNVAHGQVEHLERAYETGEERNVDRYIDQLSTAHDRMRRIIDDMLEIARHGRPVEEPATLPLRSVVAEAWRTTDNGGGRLVVDGDLGVISAHDGRLRQLFENLFRNSVEHGSTSSRTESGDSVEHGSTGSQPSADDSVEHGSTSSRTESGDAGSDGASDVTVTVGLLDDDDGFYVADDGDGIPSEDRDSVFEPGVSTTEEGTGLGLGIVRTVAQSHGWTVSVAESDDGGARFEVRTEPSAASAAETKRGGAGEED